MPDGGEGSRADPTFLGGGITAAIMTVVVWIAEARWQIQIPADVAAAMTAILSSFVAWISRWYRQRGKRA